MPKKYVYRRQMSGLLDYHGFRTQTEEFLNDIDGDISAANAKIGNLSSLTTTDKSNLVAAINEAAQSGGGGGEEQFQKVYETTLAVESPYALITSSDMGGVYADVFVAVDFELTRDEDIVFVEFSSGETLLYSQEYTERMNHTLTGITSFGGISLRWKTDDTGSVCNNYIDISRSILYPTAELPGVTQLEVGIDMGEEQALSVGTVTVYARKPVTTPAE